MMPQPPEPEQQPAAKRRKSSAAALSLNDELEPVAATASAHLPQQLSLDAAPGDDDDNDRSDAPAPAASASSLLLFDVAWTGSPDGATAELAGRDSDDHGVVGSRALPVEGPVVAAAAAGGEAEPSPAVAAAPTQQAAGQQKSLASHLGSPPVSPPDGKPLTAPPAAKQLLDEQTRRVAQIAEEKAAEAVKQEQIAKQRAKLNTQAKASRAKVKALDEELVPLESAVGAAATAAKDDAATAQLSGAESIFIASRDAALTSGSFTNGLYRPFQIDSYGSPVFHGPVCFLALDKASSAWCLTSAVPMRNGPPLLLEPGLLAYVSTADGTLPLGDSCPWMMNEFGGLKWVPAAITAAVQAGQGAPPAYSLVDTGLPAAVTALPSLGSLQHSVQGQQQDLPVMSAPLLGSSSDLSTPLLLAPQLDSSQQLVTTAAPSALSI